MLLKLFESVFTALNKNVKLTLLAVLLSALITWIIYGERKLNSAQEDCAKDRKMDQSTILSQAEELRDMRTRLFDAFMLQQVQKENTQINDSLIRNNTQRALNTIKK